MKIIYTSEEDFIKQEVDEHGWDYVEAQFALGYEPALIDGQFYSWIKVADITNVPRTIQTNNVSSNTISCVVPNNRFGVVSELRALVPLVP